MTDNFYISAAEARKKLEEIKEESSKKQLDEIFKMIHKAIEKHECCIYVTHNLLPSVVYFLKDQHKYIVECNSSQKDGIPYRIGW